MTDRGQARKYDPARCSICYYVRIIYIMENNTFLVFIINALIGPS